ncbi:GlxA family transcriptional regulator [Jiangella rhizosphaerae]|uniref:Helix-turn-helix domain-containing protein n=1 Tax=Jiangella rhizosphaerae TaxID=2293569 RepID=A0A418KIR9_9ACTN|nr:helix-turn-helix domain-containing protein [Jiangella rhizosphaerae]RIQ13628.1 helix-turn-helix domain-containing protein [Jiangella rhizosphaerae]
MSHTHEVMVLALDGVVALDLSIPAQLFAERYPTPYRVTVCGEQPGEVMTSGGFAVRVAGGLAALADAHTVVVPGYWPPAEPPSRAVLDALRAAHERGARLVSICTGAFALAAAGILDGRRATTHWRQADELARLYPEVRVDRDALYVDEGTVMTSAGVAAGIDLCLHVIRSDLGASVANTIARDIVAAPYRPGGQSQYVERSVPPERGVSLAETRAWALGQLHRPLAVADLARHARLSERTLTRRFVAETGVPPMQWVLAARLDLARELLERGDLGIEQVAGRSGFGTPANLRVHFRRAVGTTPRDYRKAFSPAG